MPRELRSLRRALTVFHLPKSTFALGCLDAAPTCSNRVVVGLEQLYTSSHSHVATCYTCGVQYTIMRAHT